MIKMRRLVFLLAIALTVLFFYWLDAKHPLPIHAVRNGQHTVAG
jgi:hypothetical protein